jgi:hypothetical protein
MYWLVNVLTTQRNAFAHESPPSIEVFDEIVIPAPVAPSPLRREDLPARLDDFVFLG